MQTRERGCRALPFDHQLHELKTTTCQACHHDTLEKCSACHTQQGSLEGDWVPLAEAYHERTSPWSCVGCHETKKQAPDCAGCHSQMKPELSESSCLTCHSGSLEAASGFIPPPDTTLPDMEELSGELAFTLAGFTWLRLEMPKISAPEALLPDKTQEKLQVALLEKTYDPSEFPHLKIIKKLTDISNNNKLSRYYHAEETTLCAGCHHLGPLEMKRLRRPAVPATPARMSRRSRPRPCWAPITASAWAVTRQWAERKRKNPSPAPAATRRNLSRQRRQRPGRTGNTSMIHTRRTF